MSTNPNLQQINVFSKGMNTDTSDAFLSNEQYRYAENLRFVAEKGSTSTGGELCTIEGWKNKLDLTGITVLGVQSIRKYIIIVGKKSDGWYVWSVDTEAEKWRLVTNFGPCQDDIGNNISIVTRWESDENIKVYIADGVNQLMSLNIAGGKHNGLEVKEISGKLELSLTQLQAESIPNQNSRIQEPILQYAYILYKLGSSSTNISPLSKPLVLYNDNKGYYDGEVINKSVKLTLDGISSTEVDRIRVYRIGYIKNGQDPNINIIYDDNFRNGSNHQFEFIDNGYNISGVTTAEFISLNGVQFKPLLIESKNDYLFAGNVEYIQQEIDSNFEQCTATYTAELDLNNEYTLDLNNNVLSNGTYKASFKRGETYRFGIVFYDKQGRRSSVIESTIDDVTIPSNVSVFESNQNNTFDIYPYKITAQISGIPSDCSGYELVRCKRTIDDSKCITQGIVGRAYKIDSSEKQSSSRFSFQYLTLDKYGVRANSGDDSESHGISCDDLVMFASPEYVYQADDIKAILKHFNTQLKLSVISNHPIPNRSIYNSNYKLFANPGVSDSYIIEGIDGEINLIISGSGENVGSFRENGEYFLYRNSENCYYGLPGGTVTDLSNNLIPEYTSAIEYKSDGTSIDKHINVCKLYPAETSMASNLSENNAYHELSISGINFIDSPHRRFSEAYHAFIDNDKVSVGNLNFVNWDALTFYGKYGYFNQNSYEPAQSDLWNVNNNDTWKAFSVTAGGKYILLNTNLPSDIIKGDIPSNFTQRTSLTQQPISLSIAEIIHNNVSPYGGNTSIAKKNSVFYSFGDYYSYSGGNNGTATIETTNGDCYISMFTFNSGHAYDSAEYKSRMYPTVYIVPVESSINLKAAYGDLYTNMTSPYKYWFQDLAGVYGKLTQEKDAYLYNTIYNGSYNLISYTPIAYTSISNDKFDCRIHHSQIKTNGEYIDSWLNFKSADFIDVDTRYGEITDLNLFKDTLVFWQNNAAGVLSVNERTLLQDVNDANIILGNGDVLQRYDYLTTEYGMEPAQKARTQSNNALYWWDGYKKEILQYPGGREVLPLKKIKTVSRYVNEVSKSTKPCLAYDPKYAEVLMSLENNQSLVYNEYIQQFTSLYNSSFEFSSKLLDKLVLIKNRNIYKWNERGNFINFIPTLKYVVNKDSTFVKVFDNIEFGMGDKFLYDSFYTRDENDYEDGQCYLDFEFKTQGQSSKSAKYISHREYDLRMAIPRDGENLAGGSGRDVKSVYGNRMRGRTMQCTLTNNTLDVNFSLQYIVTKYRISNS